MDVYGLKNCGTCKKAMAWMDERGIAYSFHDWKEEGVDQTLVAGWIEEKGAEGVLNKAGYTWRGLSDADKERTLNGDALSVFTENSSLIKRPAFVTKDGVLLGFAKKVQEALA